MIKKFCLAIFLLQSFWMPAQDPIRGFDGMMQRGLSLGLVGTGSSTWILNQNNFGTLRKFQIPIVARSEMDYDLTWGGNFGIDATYTFKKRWGLTFQILYNWTGQLYEDNFVGPVGYKGTTDTLERWYISTSNQRTNVKRVIKLQYVQLPLLLKFQTKLGDVTNFYAQIGPQIGFRTYAYEQVKLADQIFLDSTTFTPSQKFNKIDAGIAFNVGCDFYPKSFFFISAGLNTYYGITDVNGSVLKDFWYSKNDDKYQQSHNFRLGLHLGLHFYIRNRDEIWDLPMKEKKVRKK